MKEWVKIPTAWIIDPGERLLHTLRWYGPHKSDWIAGLMLYAVIAHHANSEPDRGSEEVGLAKLSYSDLSEMTGLSRAKIASGISVLEERDLVERRTDSKTNIYRINNYDVKSGWGKLPARGLYDKDLSMVAAFKDFKLRSKVELNALKMFYLVVGLRDNKSNLAHVSYETISEYTGIARNDIKAAISFLITHELIRVEQQISKVNDKAVSHAYRLTHLSSRQHMGTTGRRALSA